MTSTTFSRTVSVLACLILVPQVCLAELQDCPKEIKERLRADLRRAFMNVTFSVVDQNDEDTILDAILSKAFGGPYLTYDANDDDNEYQVHASHGAGRAKRSYTFLYNNSKDGWVLEARLEGLFPVGSPEKVDGWRDIVTQEHIHGTPRDHTLMRTYRHTDKGYAKISETVESGG